MSFQTMLYPLVTRPTTRVPVVVGSRKGRVEMMTGLDRREGDEFNRIVVHYVTVI